MFPPINNGYSQQSYEQHQQYQINSMNDQIPYQKFTMNPTPFHNYYVQPYSSSVNMYTQDLDQYYMDHKDKVFAKFNQRNVNPNPPMGGSQRFGIPQLPQVRLPVVDWVNFQKDAEEALSQENKFMKNMDTKILVLENLLNQDDEWLKEKYQENKNKFIKANMRERDFKLKKALTDYKKFSKKYYGAFENQKRNNNNSQTQL